MEVDAGGSPVAVYKYDALGRRTVETHGTETRDLYSSTAWQVLEERVGGQAVAQSIWSPVYVDALVLRDRDTNADGTLDERLYALQDANWNVTALTDTNGKAVERYAYDPYGQATVLNGSWTVRAGGSLYAWQYRFQGLRRDLTVEYDDARFRVYSPTLMRFISTDPIGFAGGDANLYRFVGNGPVNFTDPSGLVEGVPWIAAPFETIWMVTGGRFSEWKRGEALDARVYESQRKQDEQGGWRSKCSQTRGDSSVKSLMFSEIGGMETSFKKGMGQAATLANTAVQFNASAGFGALPIRAPGSAAAALSRAAPSSRAPGTWVRVNESLSGRASAFQRQITGREGEAYIIGGVRFDGVGPGGLIEAKGPGYASFIRDGQFEPWFRGAGDLVNQARRQVGAANGCSVTWHVAEAEAAAAMRRLLQQNNVSGISIVHTPPVP